MKRKINNHLKCCCQSTTKICSSSEKILLTFICLKIFLNNFIWTQGRLSDKYAKNDKKLKLCWMCECVKKFIYRKFFGKTCLTSKSSSGNVESRSDDSPDNFPPKVQFCHKTLKNSNPPCPPFWKKNIKLNIFPGKNYFQEKFIWTDKDTILTICFQTSKNICRMSRKSLKNIDSTKKKDRLPKKTLKICTIYFWRSCWNFSKTVRNFAPNFYENKVLDFQKKLSNCL